MKGRNLLRKRWPRLSGYRNVLIIHEDNVEFRADDNLYNIRMKDLPYLVVETKRFYDQDRLDMYLLRQTAAVITEEKTSSNLRSFQG